jgi:hypothetical protein
VSETELSIALPSMPEEYDLVIIDSGAGAQFAAWIR